jgi:hypothetical protein
MEKDMNCFMDETMMLPALGIVPLLAILWVYGANSSIAIYFPLKRQKQA